MGIIRSLLEIGIVIMIFYTLLYEDERRLSRAIIDFMWKYAYFLCFLTLNGFGILAIGITYGKNYIPDLILDGVLLNIFSIISIGKMSDK